MGVAVPNTPENMKMCLCGKCPTFKGSPLTGGFFCSMGKAKEPVKQAGCLCGKCGVTAKYGLKGGIWCIRGKSADVK
jgi:hypothetical protein